MGDRIPPQNIDVERAVLGAMLIGDAEAIDKARGILQPESFYHTRHRCVFKAICALADRAEPADQITVPEELKRIDKLEEVGGPVTVAHLAGEMATTANIEYHARIVQDASVRRVLMNRAGQVAERCFDPAEDIDGLLDAAAALCLNLEQTRGGTWEPVSAAAGRAFEDSERAWQNPGVLGGVPTGLKDLDDMLDGLQASDLILVAARPSIGKTALGLSLAWHASERVPVGFVSAEMNNKALGSRLLSLVSRVDSHDVRRGRLDREKHARLQEADAAIAERRIHLSDTLREPGQIGREARRLKREHAIGLLLVDYLQLLDSPRGRRSDNREQEVSAISRRLKGTAKDLDLPVVALAQLNRKAEARPDKRPHLSDLRDSGSLEQDSNVVILLHRPAKHDLVQIQGEDAQHFMEAIIAKQRNGPTGTVKLYFDERTGFFGNWTRGEQP